MYGESIRENTENSKERIFKLGPGRIPERQEYDHVGIKASINEDNESRVAERICKSRRSLNAASGLGIRKNRLNMITCNIIFWTIIVPILSFGCEMWVLTERDKENIMAFQRFAGRGNSASPPSVAELDKFLWFRLGETYLPSYYKESFFFILTIMRMECTNVNRSIFITRAMAYRNNPQECSANKHRSPIFDILNAAKRVGMLNTVYSMINGSTPIPGKRAWSERVCSQAWKLEDAYWESIALINRDCKYLNMTSGVSTYST